MSISSSTSPDHELALQKYLLLHSQHDALQRHLSQISSTEPPAAASPLSPEEPLRAGSFSSSSPSTDDDLLSPSTDDNLLSPSPPHAIHPPNHRRTSTSSSPRPALPKRHSSLPATLDDSVTSEIAAEQLKLKSVNHQIKSTLTDLLNCASVRGDRRSRMWVQTRLMDAEKELKVERSRRGRTQSEDLGALFGLG
jgi:hypothetical protein